MTRNLALLFLLGMLAGCGRSLSDFCDDACDCEGCSDAKHDDCISEADAAENRADRDGCGDQLDDYLACIDDTQYCTSDGDWRYDCDPEGERLGRCES